MRKAIIADCATYRLTSYGNGTAYALDRKNALGDWDSAYVQGDDAAEFRDRLKAVEDGVGQTWSRDLQLHYLWAEYGDIADPIERED